jgi:hypothetical protein
MTVEIAVIGEAVVRTHKNGYVIEAKSARSKFCGNFRSILRKVEWEDAASKLEEFRDEFYQISKAKGPLRMVYPGLKGDHRSWNLPKNQCAELFTVYSMQSHLAQSDTGEKRCFPGNQGQAIGLIIEAEIEEAALSKGPFVTQELLIEFIEKCAIKARKALDDAEMLAPSESSADDEGDADDAEENEAA